MAFSNKFNHLLLTTGNKSEVAVGYCTLYGDMCGGLAVISDVPKTTVYELSNFINTRAGRELIPQNSITKPPSAELRPNQVDQDSLPPYEVLDAILHRYVEEEKGAGQIIEEGFDEATVMRIIRLIDRSEYKRRQMAPGLKVTSRAFGSGRRMPIAQNYVHRGASEARRRFRRWWKMEILRDMGILPMMRTADDANLSKHVRQRAVIHGFAESFLLLLPVLREKVGMRVSASDVHSTNCV